MQNYQKGLMKIRTAFFYCLFLALSGNIFAEVVSIDLVENGKIIDASPTLTMFWQGENSKAVLVLIPGGDGHIGLKKDRQDIKFHFYQTIKLLSNPSATSGNFDVVIFDSPYPLSPNQKYPSARGSSDHIKRIESVLAYYKEKTQLPIFIMGHSNGGISLMELIRKLQKENKTHLIGGMIVSSARNETLFSPPLNFPILFIDHKNNGCSRSDMTVYETYEKVENFSQSVVEQILITSGESQNNNPCFSGYHMYYKAEVEVSKALDGFLTRNTK